MERHYQIPVVRLAEVHEVSLAPLATAQHPTVSLPPVAFDPLLAVSLPLVASSEVTEISLLLVASEQLPAVSLPPVATDQISTVSLSLVATDQIGVNVSLLSTASTAAIQAPAAIATNPQFTAIAITCGSGGTVSDGGPQSLAVVDNLADSCGT